MCSKRLRKTFRIKKIITSGYFHMYRNAINYDVLLLIISIAKHKFILYAQLITKDITIILEFSLYNNDITH